MIGLFNRQSTSNLIFLAIYALVLKFRLFLDPVPAVLSPNDNVLFRALIRLLEWLHTPAWMYSVFVFFLLFIQAILFNRICNLQKIFPRLTDLPAMSYLLVTSLLPQWYQFSAALLINLLLLAFIFSIATMNAYTEKLAAVFNLGLLFGIALLLYKPALFLLVLFYASLLIIRPFFIREWLLALLGILTPFYFIGVYLFLADKFSWQSLMPVVHFARPELPASVMANLGILLLVLVFLLGGIQLQQNLNKMLIQARKSWNLILILLVIAILISSVGGDAYFESWLLSALPFAAFHAAAYFFPSRKLFPLLMHWILFIYALYLNYWV